MKASGTLTTRLLAHRRRLQSVFPDHDYVMKYTDQGPHPGNHWFWKDGKRDHGHNEAGLAYLRWKVKPSAASGYQAHGEFTVARLLIEHREGPLPPRARWENTCGLSQCINPDHWRCETPTLEWRFEVRESGLWQLVRVATGEASNRVVVVNVNYKGTVHMASILPLDQRSMSSPRAMCGDVLPIETSVVTLAPVTCGKCV